MNEQNLKLVEQLAQKLGTTTEYLWQILLKQAPISAAIDLFYLVLAIIGGLAIYKLHKHLDKETSDTNSIYYKEGWTAIPMIIIAIIWGIIFISCFLSLGNIINGIFNPEYWALDKILTSCK